MKQENTNSMLDALFQQARNAEPVFSEKDMEQLFSQHSTPNEIMHDTQFTSSLTTTGKVIITKGIVMMSTLGLGIASAFTYYLLSSTTPVATERPIASNTTPPKEIAAAAPTISEPLANASSQATYVDDTLKRQRRIVIIKKDGIDPSKVSINQPSIHPVVSNSEQMDKGMLKDINVAGITPKELSLNQLTDLGIETDLDGGITFYQRDKETSKVIKLTLLPQNGITLPINIRDEEIQNKTIPSFAPRIVTTVEGRKRLMQFSSENVASHFGDLFPDSAKARASVMISKNESNNGSDFAAQSTSEITNADGTKRMVQVNRVVRTIQKDSAGITTDKLNIDSMLNALGIDPAKAHGNVKIQVTVNDEGMKKMAHPDIVSDSMAVERIVNSISDKINPESWPEIMKNIVAKVQEEAPDPNLLVPVLVKNTSSSAKNDLIFWYEPSDIQPYLAHNAAEDATASIRAPHGAISELSIYPNPARSEASVKYNLKDARTVSFAIHNLLGQKVQEVQTMPANAGSGEVSVNVSSLEPGLYLLVLSTDKGEQMIKRLVVER